MEKLTVCEKCNHYILEGDWPFCPHPHMDGNSMIERDEIPGGVVCENYGPTPITFYSHSERKRYMEAHGLREKETFCPAPGTDKDPAGIPNPAGYMDDYTMKYKTELLCRNGAKADKPFDAVESGVMVGLSSGVISEQDVIAVAAGEPGRSARVGRRTNGER